MKQFILRQLSADAGSLKIAITGTITFLVTKPVIKDWLGFSDSEAVAFGVACGTGVAWILTTIAAYYNREGVKEIQENLNQISTKVTKSPLKIDGVAGQATVDKSADIATKT